MIVNILNNKSVWKLMALISYSPGAGYTRKELLALLKWNNLTLDRTLKKLEFYRIIKKEGRIIKLDFSNPETNSILAIIEEDKRKLNYLPFEIFVVVGEFLRRVESLPIDSIYLFGSFAKKTASIQSDIDIAVFSHKKLNLIKAKDDIMQEFDKEIQIHYFKTCEKGALIDDIYKNGVKIL